MPGITTGLVRFLVATPEAVKEFNGIDGFVRKVNHVINYQLPKDIEEYIFRVSLLSNSEKVHYQVSLK